VAGNELCVGVGAERCFKLRKGGGRHAAVYVHENGVGRQVRHEPGHLLGRLVRQQYVCNRHDTTPAFVECAYAACTAAYLTRLAQRMATGSKYLLDKCANANNTSSSNGRLAYFSARVPLPNQV
jgi:hypothetical protein